MLHKDNALVSFANKENTQICSTDIFGNYSLQLKQHNTWQ